MLARTRSVVGADAAEDAVQLALVNAWRALRSGCQVDNVRGWLLTIAHRCALQWLRDRREAPAEISELVPGGVTPPDALDRSIRTREVLRAVSRLPDDERRAFVATAIHGSSGRATASALGVSEVMVRQLVFRARARVRAAAQVGLPAAWLPGVLGWLHARARGTARWVQFGSDGASAQAGGLAGRVAIVLVAGALVGGAPAAIHGLLG
ncbi:MAG TPA: sigma-70 family RNA polymerase sigma factor, partial [Solirubrobacteraceae bacterium]|nr:sigma-70 family RNA polymerase sigma factor [Solirubrobacteraceae bacterium]